MAKTQEKLYKVTRVRARKPAQVKMCPHCKKNIAARGLQGHIRIVHPEKLGLPKPIPKNSKTEPNFFEYKGKKFSMAELAALAEKLESQKPKKSKVRYGIINTITGEKWVQKEHSERAG